MFKKILNTGEKTRVKDVIVVSGLPRSGTSMMMKMLAEGGLETVTDALRMADEDNPNGYFEFEPVKKMNDGDISWLENSKGKVVKVISALLEYLPIQYHYKVIFMERSMPEVLASQKKMLSNRAEGSAISDAEMEEQFKKHLAAIKYWLARQEHMDVLYVEYSKMLADPASSSRRIAEFLNMPLNLEKMQAVPSERLYRNRAASS